MARRKQPRAPKRKPRRAGAAKSAPLLITSLSSDWYWEQDAEHRFTRLELQSGGVGDPDLVHAALGKRRWECGIEVHGGWDAHRALLEARRPFRDVLMWR